MSTTPSHDSSDYYDLNADAFEAQTVALDMNELYAPFLAELPRQGTLLDAGCGPGRDALAFRELGFTVDAFDASAEMARLASRRLEKPVPQARFQDLETLARYDGIWACASLLHVPLSDLPDVLLRLERALNPSGVLYASFKYGHGEVRRGDRHFTDLDEATFADLIRSVETLQLERCWITADRRPGRVEEHWLNVLVVKRPARTP